MNRGLLALASALILAAGASGCGGDESTTTATTVTGVTGYTGEAPTYPISDDLIADKYCRQAEHDLDKAAAEQFGGQQPSPEDLTEFVNDHYLPIMRRQMAQIRTIPIPEGQEDA